jgi:hypothetical protein
MDERLRLLDLDAIVAFSMQFFSVFRFSMQMLLPILGIRERDGDFADTADGAIWKDTKNTNPLCRKCTGSAKMKMRNAVAVLGGGGGQMLMF